MAAVSALGRTVCVLIRRLNSSCTPSGVCGSDRLPLARREARESEQSVACFFQAVGDGAAFEPPFSEEGFSFGLDLLAGLGVNHVVAVGRDLLMQPVRRVSEEITVLVHRAALNRHIGPERRQRLVQAGTAVDDDEFRRLQAARGQVVQQGPPSRFAFPAHVLDRQQRRPGRGAPGACWSPDK